MEGLVSFSYRSTKMGALTKVYVIKDGHVVKPRFMSLSKTGNHGEEYYDISDVESADVILTIDVSNSGKHYCKMNVLKNNVKSIEKALRIHRCEKLIT